MQLGRAIAVAIVLLLASCESRQPLLCTLTISGYDATGNKAETPRILDVRNVLGEGDERTVPWYVVNGRTVYLPARLGGLMVSLRFADESHRYFQMYRCQQKYSAVFAGKTDDSPVTRLSGRVTGCRLNGEWWIRLYPMFGGYPLLATDALESTIDPISGRFEVAGQFAHMRHTATLGRGKDPVHSLGIDIDSSKGEVNLGQIDLTGRCPSDPLDSAMASPPEVPGDKCTLTINGYDAGGDRIKAPSILGVYLTGDHTGRPASGLAAEGRIVSFPRSFLGKEVEVQFAKRGAQLVALRKCHQTVSMVFERRSGNLDVSGSPVSGRLTGCPVGDDWWIRFYPMFGGPVRYRDNAFEGEIDPRTGRFEAIASLEGLRHTVIVGRGKDPLHTAGFNLRQEADNELGAIDMVGRCPDPRAVRK